MKPPMWVQATQNEITGSFPPLVPGLVPQRPAKPASASSRDHPIVCLKAQQMAEVHTAMGKNVLVMTDTVIIHRAVPDTSQPQLQVLLG